MITSIQNVHDEFYKIFFKDNSYATPYVELTPYKGATIQVPVRTGLKSGEDRAEESRERYPVITIVKKTPKPRKGYFFPDHPYWGLIRDTDDDGIDDSISQIYDAIALVQVYEVSIACRKDSEYDALQQYFLDFDYDGAGRSSTRSALIFNKVAGFEEELGDYVEFDFEHLVDMDREDGILETKYQFTLYPYVNIKDAQTFEFVRELILNINSQQSTLEAIPERMTTGQTRTIRIEVSDTPSDETITIEGTTIEIPKYYPSGSSVVIPHLIGKVMHYPFYLDSTIHMEPDWDSESGTWAIEVFDTNKITITYEEPFAIPA